MSDWKAYNEGSREITSTIASYELSIENCLPRNDIENLRASIINISADGQVDIGEQEEFKQILESLDLISNNAKALELWAKKNIKNI